MANSFNEFFTSMPAKIVSEIAPVDPNNIPPFANNLFSSGGVERDIPLFNMSDNAVSPQDIIDATNNLQPKLSMDMCGISLHFIKKFIPVLANPLSHVFSRSLQEGLVPVQLKITKVIPIYKSGDRQSMDNYRPISLLNNFSKILEKIVSTRLTDFLESNNLLSKFQFGFRKSHSTLHPLVHFMN